MLKVPIGKMKTYILTLTLAAFFAAVARAELKWEQTQIELHPAVADKQAVAHFKYENAGNAPVHFKSVHASCGCTTAQTQKDQVAPGEKGEITATFNIGDRTGTQTKTVTVQTDDPDPAHATTVLTLKAFIIQALEIKPMFVFWRGGDEPKPKTIEVKAAKEFPARNLTVKSSSPDFTANVQPGKSAGEWKIEVQPKETSHPSATALTIQTDFPKDAPRSFSVNAQVTSPPAPTGAAPPAGLIGNTPALIRRTAPIPLATPSPSATQQP
jgi:hypothetical protein